jgi:acyl-CoA synthetase (AMP-forming)/AMP-acid ligase II
VRKTKDALLAAWSETLVKCPAQPAIFDGQGRMLLRFRDIEELSVKYAGTGSSLTKFEPGEIVAFQIGNHPHWASLFLACLRLGIVVLPVEKTVSEAERARALRSCRVAGLMTSPEKPIDRIAALEPIDWDQRQPVLLKLTSGTTAMPRAVRFRSEQLLADATQICDTMGITDADLNFAVIPISHSYGFNNLLTPLLVCGIPMAVSSDRLPRAVLDGLERTAATVFPGMPLFFQAFGEIPEAPKLPKLRLCISAGAPLSRVVGQRFRHKFGCAIHSFYGASECGGICYDAEAADDREAFVGRPMKRVELEPFGVEAAKPTQVRVRSAAIGDGYFPQPEPDKLGSGFFVPDDLLLIDEAGVRLAGRVSDVINVAGKKVNPAEVEAHLLSHKQVREAVVFGRSSPLRNEEVVACVVVSEAMDEAALLRFCRARLSGWQVPKRIYFIDRLPTNERGKVSRRQLAENFPGN